MSDRRSLVLEGASPQAAAAACGASRATGYRLWRRYREGGWAALLDRPPVPKRQPRRLSVSASRDPRSAFVRQCWPSDRGGVARAASVNGLEGPAPLRRLATAAPTRAGAVATSGSGRASSCTSTSSDSAASGRSGRRSSATGWHAQSRHAGWQYLHLAIDDHSRLAYGELLPNERPVRLRRLPPPRTRLVRRSRRHDRTRTQRQRQRLPLPCLDAPPAPSSASSAAIRARVARRPTAKPKRSSRRCCANGPIASPTPQASTAHERCPATSAGTTSTDHTARSEADHRSAASHRSVWDPTAGQPTSRAGHRRLRAESRRDWARR